MEEVNKNIDKEEKSYWLESILALFVIKSRKALKERLSLWSRKVLPIGATQRDLLKRESTRMKQSFADSVREGQLRGENVSSVLQRVRTGISTATRNATTIFRTGANAVSNQLRDKWIQARGLGYVHISILDNRTSFVCISRSNRKWNKDKKPIGHGMQFRLPPLHYNCRSKMVPLVPGMELPESYPAWLKQQPRSVQREVLGPGRLKLFDDGKLNLRQLVNASTGKPITLEQLRSR
jgi:SPP1 gp7 family putative phage head morphogenesis protein